MPYIGGMCVCKFRKGEHVFGCLAGHASKNNPRSHWGMFKLTPSTPEPYTLPLTLKLERFAERLIVSSFRVSRTSMAGLQQVIFDRSTCAAPYAHGIDRSASPPALIEVVVLDARAHRSHLNTPKGPKYQYNRM